MTDTSYKELWDSVFGLSAESSIHKNELDDEPRDVEKQVSKKLRRRYTLHYNLRKRGNTVNTKEMWVEKRAREVSSIENKWLKELMNLGYCVSDALFTPPHTGG